MDDVLPKPFTRKSLLDMLEKHLVHLKTMSQGMEAPPSAATVTMAAQNSASQSIKEDSSPGQSPAASLSNWQSPGQFQNIQAVQPSVPAVQGQFVPAAPAAYAVDQSGVQYPAPPPVAVPTAGAPTAGAPTAGPPTAGAPTRPPHRRQMSEMTSAPDNPNMAKRPRMYPQAQQPMLAVQAGRPG